MYAALAVIAAIGLALFAAALYFDRGTTIRRKMRSVPLVGIADIQEGQRARVHGVPSGTPLLAPLSGRSCVYYAVVVEEEVVGQTRNYWVKTASEAQWTDFLLTDPSGQLHVLTTDAVAGALFRSAQSGGFHVNEASMHAFLERQATKGIRIPSRPHRTVRMTEAILEIGTTIAVVGTVKGGRLQSVPGQALWATDDIEFR